MTIVDRSVTPIAVDLLTCLTEAVQQLDDPPASVMLRPGTQAEFLLSAMENECCSGLGWVRLTTVFPSSRFPEPDTTFVSCSPVQYAAVYELGVARCAPIGDENRIPTADEWNTTTGAVMADAAAMRRAVCCWVEANPDTMFLAGAWTPLVTEGGCAGGSMTITIAVDACDCADQLD